MEVEQSVEAELFGLEPVGWELGLEPLFLVGVESEPNPNHQFLFPKFKK